MKFHLRVSDMHSTWKKLSIHLESVSLIKKLILSYIFILAIPIACFAIYAFHNIRESTQQDIIKTELLALQKANMSVQRNIEVCQSAVQFIIGYGELLDFISDKEIADTAQFVEFRKSHLKNLERIQNTNPDIYRLRLYIENHNIPEIWPSIYYEERLRQEYWYDDLLKSSRSEYWRFLHIENRLQLLRKHENTEEVVTLYREIKYPGNEHLGVIEVSMNSNVFFGDAYANTREENAVVGILENKDAVIKYNQQLFFEQNDLSEKTVNRHVLPLIEGEEGSVVIQLDGKPMIVVYTWVKNLDIYIYKIISIQDMIAKVNMTRNFILLGTLGSLVILSLVTYASTSLILKKMQIIIDSMRKVQQGELNVEIPVRGNDEIGELAHHFRKMLRKLNELISIVVREEVATKEAEIRALQTQINAHFLYNVLESIKMMAIIEYQYDIADAITSLGRIMRYSMNWKKKSVLLKDELEYIENYIMLLNIRYDNRIKLHFHVDEGFREKEICKMSIQPIVENAVVHGLENKIGEANIWIQAYRQGELWVVEVTDDGVGMTLKQQEKLQKAIEGNDHAEPAGAKNGIGLRNVNERIKLFYGSQYGLTISSEEHCFTKVRIKLPYHKVY